MATLQPPLSPNRDSPPVIGRIRSKSVDLTRELFSNFSVSSVSQMITDFDPDWLQMHHQTTDTNSYQTPIDPNQENQGNNIQIGEYTAKQHMLHMLQQEIANFKYQIERLTTKYNESLGNNRILEQENNLIQQSLDQFQEKHYEKCNELECATQECISLSLELQNESKAVDDYINENKRIQIEKDELIRKNIDIQRELNHYKSESSELQQIREALRTELNSLNYAVIDLQNQVNQHIENERRSLQENETKMLNAKLSKLVQLNDNLEEKLKQMKNENSTNDHNHSSKTATNGGGSLFGIHININHHNYNNSLQTESLSEPDNSMKNNNKNGDGLAHKKRRNRRLSKSSSNSPTRKDIVTEFPDLDKLTECGDYVVDMNDFNHEDCSDDNTTNSQNTNNTTGNLATIYTHSYDDDHYDLTDLVTTEMLNDIDQTIFKFEKLNFYKTMGSGEEGKSIQCISHLSSRLEKIYDDIHSQHNGLFNEKKELQIKYELKTKRLQSEINKLKQSHQQMQSSFNSLKSKNVDDGNDSNDIPSIVFSTAIGSFCVVAVCVYFCIKVIKR